MVPSGCWIEEAEGRPLVSLGSDIADRGGGGIYLYSEEGKGREGSEPQVGTRKR
jgi:hypothetical protein